MRKIALALSLLLLATPAAAHVGHDGVSGFAHPFLGLDHTLTMIIVGLWAGLTLPRRAWIWPAVFATSMLAGFGWSQAGGAFPGAESVIIASVVALGLAVGFKVKAPPLAGAAAIALFGAAHGFAHGQETGEAGAMSFAAGFFAATLILHTAGLGLSAAVNQLKAQALARAAGFGVAAAGLAMAFSG